MEPKNEFAVRVAKGIGFDLIGFSQVDNLDNEIYNLNDWLLEGYQAGMKYMERNIDKRRDVSKILPDAKSVISLGVNYFYPDNKELKQSNAKVSKYARGKDYHFVIREMLEKFESALREEYIEFKSKSYVDTGPVMDKAWAVRSGIGWLGKHSNVISREFGSWFFIANVITNLDFEYSEPVLDFCGTCTRCIDACPTGAIAEEYVVDSNKCISYLTIENKKEISAEFKGKFDGWAFGCDICQDVCPWNIRFAEITKREEFLNVENGNLNPAEIRAMTNAEFKKRFAESPILRAKLKGIKRNLEFLTE